MAKHVLCGNTVIVHFQKERETGIDNHHVEVEEESWWLEAIYYPIMKKILSWLQVFSGGLLSMTSSLRSNVEEYMILVGDRGWLYIGGAVSILSGFSSSV